VGSSLLTDEHQTLVLNNSEQPTRKFGFSMELINVLESLPARILRFFLRFTPVAKDGSREVHTSPSMAANQLAECVSVSLFCHADKFGIPHYGDDLKLSLHNPPVEWNSYRLTSTSLRYVFRHMHLIAHEFLRIGSFCFQQLRGRSGRGIGPGGTGREKKCPSAALETLCGSSAHPHTSPNTAPNLHFENFHESTCFASASAWRKYAPRYQCWMESAAVAGAESGKGELLWDGDCRAVTR
jgi:hypothetical protein